MRALRAIIDTQAVLKTARARMAKFTLAIQKRLRGRHGVLSCCRVGNYAGTERAKSQRDHEERGG
eukprot:12109091-Alexandrium_andersonii.AAC.1